MPKVMKTGQATKTVIYDLTTGKFIFTPDISVNERTQAIKDIATHFNDNLPINAVAIVWEYRAPVKVLTADTMKHTKKYFYNGNFELTSTRI